MGDILWRALGEAILFEAAGAVRSKFAICCTVVVLVRGSYCLRSMLRATFVHLCHQRGLRACCAFGAVCCVFVSYILCGVCFSCN